MGKVREEEAAIRHARSVLAPPPDPSRLTRGGVALLAFNGALVVGCWVLLATCSDAPVWVRYLVALGVALVAGVLTAFQMAILPRIKEH